MKKNCLAAGCALALTMAMTGPTLGGQLDHTEWRPVTVGSEPLNDLKPFVRFGQGGFVSGNGGCNTFRGTYLIAGNKIEISSLAITLMACTGTATMKREQLFMRALRTAKYFKRSGTKLVLSNDASEPLAEFMERH